MDRRDRDRRDRDRRPGARPRFLGRPPGLRAFPPERGGSACAGRAGDAHAEGARSQAARVAARLRRNRSLRQDPRLPEENLRGQRRQNSSRTGDRDNRIARDRSAGRQRARQLQPAVVTDRRYRQLVDSGVISKQDYDNEHANMLQAKATLEQDLALQKYETVTAPFDGIVTMRYVDPGHLIPQSTAGVSTDSAIVEVARMKPLRLYAYMPQSTALFVRNGDQSTFTVNEYPRRKFVGTVTRHPEALAADSRTMIVEVDLPNEDLALYPGMYGFVNFSVSMPESAPMVPDDALIFRDSKVYVPVVRNNRLHLVEVTLGYDNGVSVEIAGGDVKDNDMVALNVGQAARDGELVQPVLENSAMR